VANAFVSFNTQSMHIKSFYVYTTALLCFPKNLIPWRDSKPGLLVHEADAMSTAPRRQGHTWRLQTTFVTFENIVVFGNIYFSPIQTVTKTK
jgi:hypothetical protein